MRREQMSVGVLFQGGAENSDGVIVTNRDGNEFVTSCVGTSAPSSKAGYAIGCSFTNSSTGAKYTNTGTTASCTFEALSSVTAGSVDLASLAAGITPSHIAVFAGTSTPATDSTGTIAITVTGALATDIPTVTAAAVTNAVYVKSAVCTSNTLTVTLSGAGGANTSINYLISRAAA